MISFFCDWLGTDSKFALYSHEGALLFFGRCTDQFWRRAVSLFLEEIQAIFWALQSTSFYIRVTPMMVHTDSHDVVSRMKDVTTWVKVEEFRVLRLFG